MALSVDFEMYTYASEEFVDIGVDDNVAIYKGAFVGRNRTSGLARPLVAGDEFLGIAYRRADNTGAGHVAGAIDVRLVQHVDFEYALSGAVQADVGRPAFATADDALSLTPAGNSRVGRVVALVATDRVRVRAQPVGSLDAQGEGYAIRTLADANATLTQDHMNRVLLIANSTGRTLTLPPVATARAGAWIRVVKTSAAAAAVTLDGNVAETIDGAATLATLDAQFDVAHLVCTGSEWIVLSRDIA